MATLHLVTGPWGVGKSAIVPELCRLLPEIVIFDWDILLPGLSAAIGADAHIEPSSWGGLGIMWVAVVESVLASGRDVVLLGPADPTVMRAAGFAGSDVRCAYLDLPDGLIEQRLVARGEAKADIADELAEAARLRQSDYQPIAVAGKSIEDVAEQVTLWLKAAAI